jgi:hypothetical protein
MALADDLDRAAKAAAPYGAVGAVLAAEPEPGRRSYLVALGDGAEREWLVLDDSFEPETERENVRAAASIVVLSELAGELAGGGQLEELRAQLAQLRLTEQPEGIEEAEEAALELERVIGAPPLVASPGYLDRVGAAAATLEGALGGQASPFASALASSSGTVQAFVAEVLGRHKLPLR